MIRLRFRVAALAFLLAAPALAQDGHQSHVLIESPDQDEALRLFRERIRQAQRAAGLTDVLKQFGGKSPFDLEQLQQLLKNNPQLKDLAEGLQNRDPEKLSQVRSLLEQAKLSGQVDPALIRKAQDKLQALGSQSPAEPPGTPVEGDNTPAASPPLPTDPPPDPAQQVARREMANHLADFAQRFPKEHLPESLRNSPAVQDLFNRLSASAVDALRHPERSDGLDAQLARLKTRWDGLQEWLPKHVPESMRKLQLPDITKLMPARRSRWPAIDLPPPPSAPRLGSPRVAVGPAANTILLIAAVVVVAVVFWRLRGGRFTASDGVRQPLGPWPVDPAGVASRADLIRAFEYLSLLRCGEPARTWHHRAIAACLGGTASDRRAAAARLAELYEQARYAPAGGGEPDWTAARGPLTVLAGAG